MARRCAGLGAALARFTLGLSTAFVAAWLVVASPRVGLGVNRALSSSSPSSPFSAVGAAHSGAGYWIAQQDGHVAGFGDVAGIYAQARTNSPIVALTPTADAGGRGYWLAAADGGVFSYGDARFYGSASSLRLNAAVVGMAGSPSGKGYWLVARDGGVFAFGDAHYSGAYSASECVHRPDGTGICYDVIGPAPPPNVVGMAPTTTGQGYWLVTSTGETDPKGDAIDYRGNRPIGPLNQPVVGIVATPSGHGFWMVAADGGVFSFGDAGFYGSTANLRLNQPVVGMTTTPSGHGYWLLGADGGVFSFGDARFLGNGIDSASRLPG